MLYTGDKAMQAQDVRVTIRVNRELKENAEALFDYLGLNMSNAVNIFLRKTVDQRGIPFQVNADSQGFAELGVKEVTGVFKKAVKQDIAKKQKKGLPIARYDKKSGRAYLENTDGSREYV
jgi:addiction module RelB/DinJ family antitoxin